MMAITECGSGMKNTATRIAITPARLANMRAFFTFSSLPGT